MPDLQLTKHPAEFYIRYLLLKDRDVTDSEMSKKLDDWGFLQPSDQYWGFARQRTLDDLPEGFDPSNRLHRESMSYLRSQQVYDLFFPGRATEEAWTILADPSVRHTVEQALMGRIELKVLASKLNKKHQWHLTEEGLTVFYHFFWNVRLLTFDEWGRFLFGRTSLYDRHMALLQGPPSLTFFHLRLEQNLESKKMIQRVQESAFHTYEEVTLRPGTSPDKVKSMGLLAKVVIESHNALSTSDMALKDVLQQFERFRMEHPPQEPPSIHFLAPGGNYSNSGANDSGIESESKEHVDAVQEQVPAAVDVRQ